MRAYPSSRRPPRWLVLPTFASVAPLVAQQRIFTNPKPEEHFKTVMPAITVPFTSWSGSTPGA